ncbi:actin binding protein [Pelomyxa schiedti]|nr:actin binding protein [Pelomyxa schiedti]
MTTGGSTTKRTLHVEFPPLDDRLYERAMMSGAGAALLTSSTSSTSLLSSSSSSSASSPTTTASTPAAPSSSPSSSPSAVIKVDYGFDVNKPSREQMESLLEDTFPSGVASSSPSPLALAPSGSASVGSLLRRSTTGVASTMSFNSAFAESFGFQSKDTGQYVDDEYYFLKDVADSDTLIVRIKPNIRARNFVDVLTSEDSLKETTFRMRYQLQDPSFAEEFLDQGGMALLMNIVIKQEGNTQAYALGAVRSLMGYLSGLEEIMENPPFVEMLFTLVDSQTMAPVCRQATELLLVLCSFDGFSLVHKAAKETAKKRGKDKYSNLIALLASGDIETQVNALTLFNSLLDNAPAEKQLKLLNHFKKLGIDGILRKQSRIVHPSFKTQLAMFEVNSTQLLLSTEKGSRGKRTYKELEAALEKYEEQQPLVYLLKHELMFCKNSLQQISDSGTIVNIRAPMSRHDTLVGTKAESSPVDLSFLTKGDTTETTPSTASQEAPARKSSRPSRRGSRKKHAHRQSESAPSANTSTPTATPTSDSTSTTPTDASTTTSTTSDSSTTATSSTTSSTAASSAPTSAKDWVKRKVLMTRSAAAFIEVAVQTDISLTRTEKHDKLIAYFDKVGKMVDVWVQTEPEEGAPAPLTTTSSAERRFPTQNASVQTEIVKTSSRPTQTEMQIGVSKFVQTDPLPTGSLSSVNSAVDRSHTASSGSTTSVSTTTTTSSTSTSTDDNKHTHKHRRKSGGGEATPASDIPPPPLSEMPPETESSVGTPPPPPGAGAPPPPPPPGPGLMKQKTNKPAVVPKAKMRAVHWTRLILPPPQVDSERKKCIWDSVKEQEFDESNLLEHFAMKNQAKPDATGPKPEEIAPEKRQVVRLLPSKKSNALGIMRGRFPPDAELTQALRDVDRSKISKEMIHELMHNLPSNEEEMTIREADVPGVIFDKPEQFSLLVLGIPYIRERLNFWDFANDFPEKLADICTPIQTVQKASAEIKESPALRSLLGTILAIGNYLNGGTPRGQADGFNIEMLTQFAEIKDSSSSSNLLSYAIGSCSESQNIPTELEHVSEAATVDIKLVETNLNSLIKGIQNINQTIETVPPSGSNDAFLMIANQFLSSATEDVNKAKEDLLSSQDIFLESVEFFTTNKALAATQTTEIFFGIFKTLIASCKRVAAATAAPPVKRETQKVHKKAAGTFGARIKEGEDPMGDIIALIKSGQKSTLARPKGASAEPGGPVQPQPPVFGQSMLRKTKGGV